MSTLTPALITVAIVLPLLVVLFYLDRYLRRHPQPDRAKLRLLRLQFLFFVVIGLIYFFSGREGFLFYGMIACGLIVNTLEMRKILRRLKNA